MQISSQMLEVTTEAEGRTLIIRASGTLTMRDYHDVLVPSLHATLRDHHRLRVVFFMDEDFSGWSWGAAWANTCLDISHRAKFEKIAVVGAPMWERWCARLAGWLVLKGDVRTFQRGQLAQAQRWVRT